VTRAALAALLVAALAACGGHATQPPAHAPAGGLVDVQNVFPLRAAFNDERGAPRLLLVLSPT